MSRLLQLAAGFLIASGVVPAFAGIVAVKVPEPASLALMAVGIGGVVAVRALRSRRK